MAIELISTITTKNNGSYAICKANEIEGGLHSVTTIEERDNISVERLQEGMLCWVSNDKKYYRYEENAWIEFTIEFDVSKIENILYRVTTYQDIENIDSSTLKYGHICHVTNDEKGNYIYYYSIDGWTPFKQIGSTVWIGEEEPPNKDMLWIDTSDTIENIDTSILEAITNEFTTIVQGLTDKIRDLETRIEQLENKS